MQVFTAVDIALMGEMDPQFGQTYYGTVEEQDNPVRFNLKQVVDISPGRQFVAAEVEHRTSKGSGKPYTQLKKVKLSEPKAVDQSLLEPEDASIYEDPEYTPELESLSGKSLSDAWKDTVQKPKTVDPTLPTVSAPDYEAGTVSRWAIKLSFDSYVKISGAPPDTPEIWDLIEENAIRLVTMFNDIAYGGK